VRVVLSTVAHFGRLDVLVNNAGILRMSPFMDDARKRNAGNFRDKLLGNDRNGASGDSLFMEKQGGPHIVQVGSG
jgi:NAD(P)-dependent dehydrogenase (short-subunit alcohol dehydrogenase family)